MPWRRGVCAEVVIRRVICVSLRELVERIGTYSVLSIMAKDSLLLICKYAYSAKLPQRNLSMILVIACASASGRLKAKRKRSCPVSTRLGWVYEVPDTAHNKVQDAASKPQIIGCHADT